MGGLSGKGFGRKQKGLAGTLISQVYRDNNHYSQHDTDDGKPGLPGLAEHLPPDNGK